MKLKRMVCILMTLLISIASGCGKNTPEPKKAEETITNGESVSFVDLMLGDSYLEEWNDNNVILNVSWDKLKLSDSDAEKYPNLKKTFDKLNADALENATAYMNELWYAAEECSGDEYNPLYLNHKFDVFVQRADSKLISYMEEMYLYSGGIHPDYKYTGVNIDPETGKRLLITDVITTMDELPEILSAKIREKYDYVAFGENQPAATLLGYSADDYQWTMDYQGITFWFSPYDIASYTVGPLSVKIYFNAFPELFNEKYTKAPSENYVIKLPLGQSVDFDLNPNDNKTDTLYLYESIDEYGEYSMLSVTVNSETAVDEINYAYDFDVYLAHMGNKNYIYSDSSSDNDYHMLCIWDINHSIPMQIEALYGTEIYSEYIEEGFEDGVVYKTVFNNPDKLKLEKRFEILGTRGGVASFKINATNGMPEMTDTAYTFNYGHGVKCAMSLDVVVVSDNKSKELPKGTELVPYQTDGKAFVDLKTENGSVVRLNIDATNWPIMVNGIPEDECFEELLYAG